MRAQSLTILGATGSIGVSTLDVVARHPDRYRIHALSGRTRLDVLAAQCRVHRPERVVVADAAGADRLAALLAGQGSSGAHPQIDHGVAALCDVAAQSDTVMAAIVGAAGLAPALAAARAGRRILLANKEALVMAGGLFMDTVRTHGATLLPIDSEHNAIFQCLPAGRDDLTGRGGVERIVLTASGGPFRQRAVGTLAAITPDEACAHPNWVMGRKISVDSATMMNKGLEVIEAHWLFDLAPARIEVLIHPQSVIHSMVAYRDGSMLAQLGNPDMRTPIAHALAWPERIDAGVAPLDLARIAMLSFEAPDLERFPCLRLAYAALAAGGTAAAMLNAANEVAVEAFLQGQSGYMDIPRIVAATLDAISSTPAHDLDAVIDADARARRHARGLVPELASGMASGRVRAA